MPRPNPVDSVCPSTGRDGVRSSRASTTLNGTTLAYPGEASHFGAGSTFDETRLQREPCLCCKQMSPHEDWHPWSENRGGEIDFGQEGAQSGKGAHFQMPSPLRALRAICLSAVAKWPPSCARRTGPRRSSVPPKTGPEVCRPCLASSSGVGSRCCFGGARDCCTS